MRLSTISKWTLTLAMAAFLSCSLATAQKPDDGIAKARAAWQNDFNSKDLPGLMSLYAEDAALLVPPGDRIVGKEKIEAYFKALFDSSSALHVKLDSETAASVADLGYDSGTYEQVVTHGVGTTLRGSVTLSGNAQISGGESRDVSNGWYLFVLTRKAGKWLFTQ
jgi:ketosteroid isomerase-like protein